MELTRRDAVAAIAVLGTAGGTALGVSQLADERERSQMDPDISDERVRETFRAVAAVVYPEELSGVGAFVDEFLDGRLADDAHAAGIRDAVAVLNERARSWHGDRVSELPVGTRDRLLHEIGADTADEAPGGTDAERVRYFVVNELLLALYASPAGGKLVGIENPQGHAGGIESYQQGPR